MLVEAAQALTSWLRFPFSTILHSAQCLWIGRAVYSSTSCDLVARFLSRFYWLPMVGMIHLCSPTTCQWTRTHVYIFICLDQSSMFLNFSGQVYNSRAVSGSATELRYRSLCHSDENWNLRIGIGDPFSMLEIFYHLPSIKSNSEVQFYGCGHDARNFICCMTSRSIF